MCTWSEHHRSCLFRNAGLRAQPVQPMSMNAVFVCLYTRCSFLIYDWCYGNRLGNLPWRRTIQQHLFIPSTGWDAITNRHRINVFLCSWEESPHIQLPEATGSLCSTYLASLAWWCFPTTIQSSQEAQLASISISCYYSLWNQSGVLLLKH